MKKNKFLATFLFAGVAVLFIAGCSPKSDIKVMSFNIRLSPNETFDGDNRWSFRREAVIEMLDTEKPDIFGVQEAIYHQAKYLEDNLPDYTKYGVDREGGLEKGEAEACAVFFRNDKYDMLDKGTFWLSETPDTPSKGWDAACFRVVTWVHLKEKKCCGKELYFMNTHFDHIGKTARLESGKMIVERINEIVPEGVPVIVTGDFNSTVEDEALAPLRENLLYARKAAAVTDSIPTYNGWGKASFDEVIDHIFFKNITPEKYRTITDDYGVPYLSDHYAIIFEGKLK